MECSRQKIEIAFKSTTLIKIAIYQGTHRVHITHNVNIKACYNIYIINSETDAAYRYTHHNRNTFKNN